MSDKSLEFSIVTASMVVTTENKAEAAAFVKDAAEMHPMIQSMQIESNSVGGFLPESGGFNPFDLLSIKRVIDNKRPLIVIIEEDEISTSAGSYATLFLNGSPIISSTSEQQVDLDEVAGNIVRSYNVYCDGVFKICLNDKILAKSIAYHRGELEELEGEMELFLVDGEEESFFEERVQGYTNKDLYLAMLYMVNSH